MASTPPIGDFSNRSIYQKLMVVERSKGAEEEGPKRQVPRCTSPQQMLPGGSLQKNSSHLNTNCVSGFLLDPQLTPLVIFEKINIQPFCSNQFILLYQCKCSRFSGRIHLANVVDCFGRS